MFSKYALLMLHDSDAYPTNPAECALEEMVLKFELFVINLQLFNSVLFPDPMNPPPISEDSIKSLVIPLFMMTFVPDPTNPPPLDYFDFIIFYLGKNDFLIFFYAQTCDARFFKFAIIYGYVF